MKEGEPAFVMSEFGNDKQMGDIALTIELELDKIKTFTLEGSVNTNIIQGIGDNYLEYLNLK